MLARLAEWSKNELGFAFGAPAIAWQTTTDTPDEVVTVVSAIEAGVPLPMFQDRQERWTKAA